MKPETFDGGIPVDQFRSQHIRWLKKLDLLDRPWLILGSAPSPTLPASLLHSAARVDINNVGKTAAKLGLGPADLTIRAKIKSWEEHPHTNTRGLIWIRSRKPLIPRLLLLGKPYDSIGHLSILTKTDRNRIVTDVSGASLETIGDLGKVTNGVAAACYALFLGVPEVILAGISLSKIGHSYDDLGRGRRQIEEDAFVLDCLKNDHRLATTERDLSSETGIRLR